MKLVRCRSQGTVCLGVLEGREVRLEPPADPGEQDCRPRDIAALIDRGAGALEELAGNIARQPPLPQEELQLLAPIPRPRQDVICLGWNYAEHVRETTGDEGGALPEHPVVFTKSARVVNDPYGDIPWRPELSRKMDWEAELAVILGTPGADIPAERALGHVFGYTVVNDITARDLQKRHRQFFLGKSLPGSCPMGPCVVTAEELPDPQALAIRSWVNGELRQDSHTSMQIFPVAQVIAIISRILPLEAGDIISTGTPGGVGYRRDPPQYLQPGDLVECEVEGVGRIANRVRQF